MSYDNTHILVNKLIELNETITTAESCTGGLLSAMLIDVPGVSSVYNEGHITYANSAKIKYLGVPNEILESKGAVSEDTAYAMAQGAANLADANMAIAITGLAGPDGGTTIKPVGLVYISCYYNGNVKVEANNFKGNRLAVRTAAANRAIELALSMFNM